MKGLAGAAGARTLPRAARAAERLAVLRREVDRMQAILDEFLNFSRPLVPLALGHARRRRALPARWRRCTRGWRRSAASTLEVDGRRGRTARCDPRKVKQVLINLVQNALDAAPRGAAVMLQAAPARRRRRGCGCSIADRGLEPGARRAGLRARASPPRRAGSGLGLTIARALAPPARRRPARWTRASGGADGGRAAAPRRRRPRSPPGGGFGLGCGGRHEPAGHAGAGGRRRPGRPLHAARDPRVGGAGGRRGRATARRRWLRCAAAPGPRW
ncbi:MAG: hypothetical protein MZW92_15610 [Comamonadaceae bacterium]|nr:hypothetical protein [Comamonadaceae bacterium]